MKSDRLEGKENDVKGMVYSKGKTMLPVLLTSLCLALMALGMLLWIPSSISYKNISSLSELNEEKVRFYTENQHIHLVYKFGQKQDTIRSVSDYEYSLKKENLKAEAIRASEYMASERENANLEETSDVFIEVRSKQTSIHANRDQEDTRTLDNLIADGNSRGSFSDQEEAAIQPDEKPAFPKGQRGIEVYLARNKVTPFLAKSRGIDGEVHLRFLVNVDGSLSDIRIIKGLGYGCNEEAIRLVKNMPNWKPAIKDNEPVSYYESLHIRF